MIPRPLPPYFLIRVSKQLEKKSKSTIGSFILPETMAFMAHNTQWGEIVAIGERAHEYFPEAKVGHILIVHHFVQQNNEEEAKEQHLIHWDEEYNYYIVTAYEYAGKGNETYGVWDGEKIIPNKDYIFLHTAKPKQSDLPPEEALNQSLKVTESGLLVFDEWTETREQKEERQQELKRQSEELAKSGTHKLHINQGIVLNQWEAEAIGREISHQAYMFYTVAATNKQLSEWFGRDVVSGDTLGLLNLAAQTTIGFNGETYIVSKTKFIGCLYDKAMA